MATTTIADLRNATLGLAEEFLSMSSRERTPEREAIARRDAFVEILFAVLLSMPDTPGLDRTALLKARRIYWREILAERPMDDDWKAVLVESLEMAGDERREYARRGWPRTEARFDPWEES